MTRFTLFSIGDGGSTGWDGHGVAERSDITGEQLHRGGAVSGATQRAARLLRTGTPRQRDNQEPPARKAWSCLDATPGAARTIGRKKSTRPGESIWEGNVIIKCKERGRHEQGAKPQARGRRTACVRRPG